MGHLYFTRPLLFTGVLKKLERKLHLLYDLCQVF